VSYLVSILSEVKDEDIPDLPDDDVRLAAVQIVRALYSEPRIGDPMRERYNLRVLAGCRKVLFDKDGWEGKPRFRLVFRNEPGNEAVDRVTVLSIGPRADLAAYRVAAGRLGAQRRTKRGTKRGE
jgi:hypothetical protein